MLQSAPEASDGKSIIKSFGSGGGELEELRCRRYVHADADFICIVWFALVRIAAAASMPVDVRVQIRPHP